MWNTTNRTGLREHRRDLMGLLTVFWSSTVLPPVHLKKELRHVIVGNIDA
jgi:hypothetical protein